MEFQSLASRLFGKTVPSVTLRPASGAFELPHEQLACETGGIMLDEDVRAVGRCDDGHVVFGSTKAVYMSGDGTTRIRSIAGGVDEGQLTRKDFVSLAAILKENLTFLTRTHRIAVAKEVARWAANHNSSFNMDRFLRAAGVTGDTSAEPEPTEEAIGRKEFVSLADYLSRGLDFLNASQRASVVDLVAAWAATQNPRFDRERFVRAAKKVTSDTNEPEDEPTEEDITEGVTAKELDVTFDVGMDKAKKAVFILSKVNRSNGSAVEKAMEEVSELLGQYGVEAVRDSDVSQSMSGPGGYWHDTVLLYVNTGDTYNPTVLFDTNEEEFSFGSWGDWLEGAQSEYPDEEEPSDESTEFLEWVKENASLTDLSLAGEFDQCYERNDVDGMIRAATLLMGEDAIEEYKRLKQQSYTKMLRSRRKPKSSMRKRHLRARRMEYKRNKSKLRRKARIYYKRFKNRFREDATNEQKSLTVIEVVCGQRELIDGLSELATSLGYETEQIDCQNESELHIPASVADQFFAELDGANDSMDESVDEGKKKAKKKMKACHSDGVEEAKKLSGLPSVSELVSELQSVEVETGDDEDENYVDVRLQVHNGSWSLNTGDSSYDTDHRGYWGAGSVTPDMSAAELRSLAKDLIDQVKDDFAQGGGEDESVEEALTYYASALRVEKGYSLVTRFVEEGNPLTKAEAFGAFIKEKRKGKGDLRFVRVNGNHMVEVSTSEVESKDSTFPVADGVDEKQEAQIFLKVGNPPKEFSFDGEYDLAEFLAKRGYAGPFKKTGKGTVSATKDGKTVELNLYWGDSDDGSWAMDVGPSGLMTIDTQVKKAANEGSGQKAIWVRIGDSGEYEEFGDIASVAGHLYDNGVKGPFSRGGEYAVTAPGYTGQNYISMYWGEEGDAGDPSGDITDKELASLNRLFKSKNEGDDRDFEDDEPGEDDITTEDEETWYANGKVYVRGGRADVKRKMDQDQFWPNVFVISDHGNSVLISGKKNWWKESVDEWKKKPGWQDRRRNRVLKAQSSLAKQYGAHLDQRIKNDRKESVDEWSNKPRNPFRKLSNRVKKLNRRSDALLQRIQAHRKKYAKSYEGMDEAQAGLQAFIDAYLEAALWSSTDDDDKPMDDNYGEEDLSKESKDGAKRDCTDFYNANRDLLLDAKKADSNYTDAKAGMDFWLSRNGHGAGFFDHGTEDVWKELQKKAKVYGGVDLYVGDDGKIYGESIDEGDIKMLRELRPYLDHLSDADLLAVESVRTELDSMGDGLATVVEVGGSKLFMRSGEGAAYLFVGQDDDAEELARKYGVKLVEVAVQTA